MPKHVILHDRRLNGFAPAADLNVTVDSSDTLRATLARIRQYALSQSGPVTMDILCHGFETHNDPVGRQSVVRGIGGLGLQLCREGLRHNTVNTTVTLADVVSTITVYACSAAHTHANYVGTNRDGQQLFREMSALTNATIYAADATQYYWNLNIDTGVSCSTVIDFKRFEGNLWMFTPDGNSMIIESNQLTPH